MYKNYKTYMGHNLTDLEMSGKQRDMAGTQREIAGNSGNIAKKSGSLVEKSVKRTRQRKFRMDWVL